MRNSCDAQSGPRQGCDARRWCTRQLFPVQLRLLAALLTFGGAAAATAADTALTKGIALRVGDIPRTYDLHVPTTRAAVARPLVILLHGHGGSAHAMLGGNRKTAPFKPWLAIANREGLIIAVPDGTIGPDGERGWNDCRSDAPGNPRVDDVAFIKTMIEHIARTQPIDRTRVYVAGISNGGHMALRLAAEMTDAFAAAGVVAASMPRRSRCRTPSQALSIAFMNGTADPLSPYGGGSVGWSGGAQRGTVMSTDESVRWWVQHNAAAARPTRHDYPDRLRGDGSTVHRTVYVGGKDGAAVALFEVRGGGHAAPSASERYARPYRRLVGPQNGDIESAEEMWAFFKDKRR